MARTKIEKLNADHFNEQKRMLLEQFPAASLTLGQATRQMRLLLGMTQTEYGEKIVGLSRKIISAIENDLHNPELETLKKIARPFGLKIGFMR